jgi:putative transposase
MGTRTGRNRVSAPHAHSVFVTKYRHAAFAGRHLERLEDIMRDACADFEVQP